MGTVFRSKIICGLIAGLVLGPFVISDPLCVGPEGAHSRPSEIMLWGGVFGVVTGLLVDVRQARGLPVKRMSLLAVSAAMAQVFLIWPIALYHLHFPFLY